VHSARKPTSCLALPLPIDSNVPLNHPQLALPATLTTMDCVGCYKLPPLPILDPKVTNFIPMMCNQPRSTWVGIAPCPSTNPHVPINQQIKQDWCPDSLPVTMPPSRPPLDPIDTTSPTMCSNKPQQLPNHNLTGSHMQYSTITPLFLTLDNSNDADLLPFPQEHPCHLPPVILTPL